MVTLHYAIITSYQETTRKKPTMSKLLRSVTESKVKSTQRKSVAMTRVGKRKLKLLKINKNML